MNNSSGTKLLNQDQISSLVNQIMTIKDRQGNFCVTKVGKDSIIHLMNSEILKKVANEFKFFDNGKVDLIDFVKIFLKCVEHDENDRIFLIMNLIEFFKEMSEDIEFCPIIKFKDISNYLVDSYVEKNLSSYQIPTKLLPPKNQSAEKSTKVRDIDIKAPIVYGNSAIGLLRQDLSKLSTDNYRHEHRIKQAVYSSYLKKLFVLDSLSDKILIYASDKKVEKVIQPNCSNNNNHIVVLNFALSTINQRIGACLKNFTLLFWDAADNFLYEKLIDTSLSIQNYQDNIWFLSIHDTWLTTDCTGALYLWNIAENKYYKKFITKTHTEHEKLSITDVKEIDYLKLVAVASSDKQINIWNFNTGIISISLNMIKGGVHQLEFFQTYQILIAAGYDSIFPMFSITPHYNDLNLMGKLIGHLTIINAIVVREGSPMVISSDDHGIIKTWDIRSQMCIQTIELGVRSIINKLLIVPDFNSLVLFSSRITFIEFSDNEISKNDNIEDVLYPFKSDFNFLSDEIVLFTRTDVRIIHSRTGQIKKIFNAFFNNEEVDEIMVAKFQQRSKKIILGDHKGNLHIFRSGTGELLKKLEGHSTDVQFIKIDYLNNLIISCGRDSVLKIQKEKESTSSEAKPESELDNESEKYDNNKIEQEAAIRLKQKAQFFKMNLNKKKQKLNGNITKTQNAEYEVFRTMKNINFGKDISSMDVSVYHNVIAISSENLIFLIDYEYMKLLVEFELPENEDANILGFLNGFSILVVSSSKGRIYLIKFLIKDNSINDINILGYFYISQQEVEIPGKALIDCDFSSQNSDENKKLICCNLYVAQQKGFIYILNLKEYLESCKFKVLPHSSQRASYNAYRIINEKFSKNINLECVSMKKKMPKIPAINTMKFKAHQDVITSISFIILPHKYLMTTSIDCYCNIFTVDGILLCSLNVNHPLPIVWNFPDDSKEKVKSKIVYALKVVDNLFKRYHSIIYSDETILGLQKFLLHLIEIDEKNSENVNKVFRNKFSPQIMLDEYSPSDIIYSNFKKIQSKQPVRQNLRQMEKHTSLKIERKEILHQQTTEAVIAAKNEPIPFFDKKKRETIYKPKNQAAIQLSEKIQQLIQKHKSNQETIRPSSKKDSPLLRTKINRKSKTKTHRSNQANHNLQNFYDYAYERQLIQLNEISQNFAKVHSKKNYISNQIQRKTFHSIVDNLNTSLKTSKNLYKMGKSGSLPSLFQNNPSESIGSSTVRNLLHALPESEEQSKNKMVDPFEIIDHYKNITIKPYDAEELSNSTLFQKLFNTYEQEKILKSKVDFNKEASYKQMADQIKDNQAAQKAKYRSKFSQVSALKLQN